MSLNDSLPISNKSGHELWLLLIDHARHQWSIFKFDGDLGTYIHANAKQHIELEFYATEWAAIERITHAPVLAKYEQGEFPMGAPTIAENYLAACPHCEESLVTPSLHVCTDQKPFVLFRLANKEGLIVLEPDKIASLIWIPHRDRPNDTVKITLKNGEQGMFEIHHESATALLRCLRIEKV
jgi:hypothetical protein